MVLVIPEDAANVVTVLYPLSKTVKGEVKKNPFNQVRWQQGELQIIRVQLHELELSQQVKANTKEEGFAWNI